MYREPRPIFRIVTSPDEAEEHLRVIRQAMERSTKHSTLSGLSGVVVGLIALLGCVLTLTLVREADWPLSRYLFVLVWGGVFVLSVLADAVCTKRRAARVGKTARSHLRRQLALAAALGFLTTLVFWAFYVLDGGPASGGYLHLYGIWMVCYAISLLGVGMFSVREVNALGWAFLAAGAATLLFPAGWFLTSTAMMALTFGGLHIFYGVWMGSKYGW